MKSHCHTVRRRAGFTLIELLVVIAIIGILISLVSAAVMKILEKGPSTKTSADIAELQAAIGTFKTKFGVKYLPSRFLLCERITQYQSSADPVLAANSLAFLQAMFSKSIGYGSNGSVLHLDWNADGRDTGPVVLEGHQCLVFFLGGVQVSQGQLHGCEGFSRNKRNPSARGGERIRFFEFKPKFLTNRSGYFSYMDGWEKQPYAYFSSEGTENGYGVNDCRSLGVQPYYKGDIKGIRQYHRPDGFQIISAGADGIFGAGGQFNPDGQSNLGKEAEDNLSNFHEGIFGS